MMTPVTYGPPPSPTKFWNIRISAMPVATSRTPTSLCMALSVGMMNQFMKKALANVQAIATRQSPTE